MPLKTGYYVEQKYSQIYLVDETDQDNPMPVHKSLIGELKTWKEEYVSIPKTPKKIQSIDEALQEKKNEEDLIQKKIIYYEIEDKGTKQKEFFAVMVNPDQNLSSLAVQTTKKEIDPFSQQLINRTILFISVAFNIILMAMTMNEENFVLRITLANAGWVLSVMLALKILDLSQQKPGIYSALFTLVKARVYHPVLKKTVIVKYTTILISDKTRVSDILPLQIETMLIFQALDMVEKYEQRYVSEKEARENAEKIIETLNERINESDKREKIIMKEAYARGVKHASTKISTKAPAKEVFKEYKNLWIGIGIFLGSIILAATIKSLAESFPDVTVIVNLADLPWFVWLVILLAGWGLFMVFYNFVFGRLR